MNTNTAVWSQLLTEVVTKPVEMPAPVLRRPVTSLKLHLAEWSTAEWSTEQALHRLGIKLMEFPPYFLGLADGVASVEGVGLSPLADAKVRTAAHEIAHVLFNHPPNPNDAYARSVQHGRVPIQEFEAESVALLVAFALGLPKREQDISRFYVQTFLKMPMFGPLPTGWSRIQEVASRILAAGASRREAPSRINQDRKVARLAAQIRWHS